MMRKSPVELICRRKGVVLHVDGPRFAKRGNGVLPLTQSFYSWFLLYSILLGIISLGLFFSSLDHGQSETVVPTTPACHDPALHTFVNVEWKAIIALLTPMRTPA